MTDIGNVQVAIEGVLIWSSGGVGNLQLGLTLCRVVEQVDVAAFVESVMRRS